MGDLLRDSVHHAVHLERGLLNLKAGRVALDAHARRVDVRRQDATLRLQRRLSNRVNSNKLEQDHIVADIEAKEVSKVLAQPQPHKM